MNDLDDIAALLAKPGPSAGAAERSRARLLHRARSRSRSRMHWFIPAGALIAAGAAAAVVLATGMPANDRAPAATERFTGKEVLLMAAVSAERTPQGSGTYWHVTTRWSKTEIPPIESWTRRDGKRWSRGEPGDAPDAVVADWKTLRLKGAKVSFEELEKLPTDPEALKKWIIDRKGDKRDMTTSEQRGVPTHPLLALITELPAPSDVRAAAFKALAATPGVENEGPVDGGQHLRLPDPDGGSKPIELVVDPDTARVVRANLVLAGDGDVAWSDEYISVTTEWTDLLPSVKKS
ncbi:CU044_5270 family protein [Nonomuraea sp. NN258]|uniref:CU044_5270 family protein n=1 Tax=Nonomuraea antri TaxID=2730852 RepID=UPI001568D935|nr:CU044_5270 family protein [Nonomuraea antri]NRQ30869.1 CU044_5270 family protein [Nonomuraea antri]